RSSVPAGSVWRFFCNVEVNSADVTPHLPLSLAEFAEVTGENVFFYPIARKLDWIKGTSLREKSGRPVTW
ncbi:MAG: hypothetical protein WCO26_22120, partial [Deltaproteobacteria bacterium]